MKKALKIMLDFIPKRYVFSLIGFVASTLAVVLETNLSLAILYMVKTTNGNATSDNDISECNLQNKITFNKTSTSKVTEGDLDWSSEIQGIAVGAQYVGLTIGFIPGGRLAEIYGGKVVLILAIFMASVFTALSPILAHLSIYAFIACRFVVGAVTGSTFPALVYLISIWIPESEQFFISSFILAGDGTGAFVSYISAGALCASDFMGGWPSVFYLGALSGLIWCIWCYFSLFDSPSVHPSISSDEKVFIEKNAKLQPKQITSIPWKEMVTSVPLWALAAGYLGQCWILAFFVTGVTVYMDTILNLNSIETGITSCLPSLVRALAACIAGILIDYSRRKRDIPIIYIRKGVTLANSIMASLGFIGVLFAGCDVTLNTIFFVIAAMFGLFYVFGVTLVAIDMAPNLSGTLAGIMCFISTSPFFLLPPIIGYVTKHELICIIAQVDKHPPSMSSTRKKKCPFLIETSARKEYGAFYEELEYQSCKMIEAAFK